MTVPDDDPDKIPTQAELDAMDLAELASTSAESNVAYPPRDEVPGPPPSALSRDAWVLWWIAAAAGIASAVYLLANMGGVIDGLKQRFHGELEQAIADTVAKGKKPINSSPDELSGLAHFLPPLMLVVIVLLLVVEFALLRGIANHHSRNARNLFLAAVLINLVCIPTGMDLLRYDQTAPTMAIIGWVQFAALIGAGACVLRPVVGRWLPPSTGLTPAKLLRPGKTWQQ